MNINFLNSNKLKIIAIISMLLDHIGYYFSSFMNNNIYLYLRFIGRIAMPIFVFLIYQGYIHTKSKKNYAKRLIIIAILTEISLFLLTYLNVYLNINIRTFHNYLFNIVFSFFFSVCILYLFDLLFKKISKEGILKNLLKNILIISLILLIFKIYFIINIDYGIIIPILILTMYFLDKITSSSSINCNVIKIGYSIAILITSILLYKQGQHISLFIIFSIPFILLYNNKLGIKSKSFQRFFYLFFLIHHIVLYLLSIILHVIYI